MNGHWTNTATDMTQGHAISPRTHATLCLIFTHSYSQTHCIDVPHVVLESIGIVQHSSWSSSYTHTHKSNGPQHRTWSQEQKKPGHTPPPLDHIAVFTTKPITWFLFFSDQNNKKKVSSLKEPNNKASYLSNSYLCVCLASSSQFPSKAVLSSLPVATPIRFKTPHSPSQSHSREKHPIIFYIIAVSQHQYTAAVWASSVTQRHGTSSHLWSIPPEQGLKAVTGN